MGLFHFKAISDFTNTAQTNVTFSMSSGIISCANRTINVSGIPFQMIQVDTSINSGNSGGPLLKEYGEVSGSVVCDKKDVHGKGGGKGAAGQDHTADSGASHISFKLNPFITSKLQAEIIPFSQYSF